MSRHRGLRKWVAQDGTDFIAPSGAVCNSKMRIIGLEKLQRFVESELPDMAGAVAALGAELREAKWAGPSDPMRAYPSGRFEGVHAEINLGGDWLLLMLVNYEASILLVEEVIARRARHRRRRGIRVDDKANPF